MKVIIAEININVKSNAKMKVAIEIANLTLINLIRSINVEKLLAFISANYVTGNVYFQIICMIR